MDYKLRNLPLLFPTTCLQCAVSLPHNGVVFLFPDWSNTSEGRTVLIPYLFFCFFFLRGKIVQVERKTFLDHGQTKLSFAPLP